MLFCAVVTNGRLEPFIYAASRGVLLKSITLAREIKTIELGQSVSLTQSP